MGHFHKGSMEHEITRGADCLGTSIPHHLIRSYSEVFYELRYNGGERGRLHRLIIFRRDTIVDEGPTFHQAVIERTIGSLYLGSLATFLCGCQFDTCVFRYLSFCYQEDDCACQTYEGVVMFWF